MTAAQGLAKVIDQTRLECEVATVHNDPKLRAPVLLPRKPYMHNYLGRFDMVSFLDGAEPALYTSGQLTLFRNVAYFERFWAGRYNVKMPDGGVAPMDPALEMCEPGNRLWDEKYACQQLLHAASQPHVGACLARLQALLTLSKDDAEPQGIEAKRRLPMFVNSLFMALGQS